MFLTKEQSKYIDALRLDWERHNVWLLLKDTSGVGPCLCTKCNDGAVL
jgi:hypothetical protein